MPDVIIIWDLPEDPGGNVHHIATHNITIDEVVTARCIGRQRNKHVCKRSETTFKANARPWMS